MHSMAFKQPSLFIVVWCHIDTALVSLSLALSYRSSFMNKPKLHNQNIVPSHINSVIGVILRKWCYGQDVRKGPGRERDGSFVDSHHIRSGLHAFCDHNRWCALLKYHSAHIPSTGLPEWFPCPLPLLSHRPWMLPKPRWWCDCEWLLC